MTVKLWDSSDPTGGLSFISSQALGLRPIPRFDPEAHSAGEQRPQGANPLGGIAFMPPQALGLRPIPRFDPQALQASANPPAH